MNHNAPHRSADSGDAAVVNIARQTAYDSPNSEAIAGVSPKR
jgi:hypothetical protein